MILTDGTTTFTSEDEEIEETPIGNYSVIITRGGKRIQQGDAQAMQIATTVRMTATDYATFNSIIENTGATLTYTPVRKLGYKSALESMTVVISEWPSITQRAWAGEFVFYVQMTLIEVVGA